MEKVGLVAILEKKEYIKNSKTYTYYKVVDYDIVMKVDFKNSDGEYLSLCRKPGLTLPRKHSDKLDKIYAGYNRIDFSHCRRSELGTHRSFSV